MDFYLTRHVFLCGTKNTQMHELTRLNYHFKMNHRITNKDYKQKKKDWTRILNHSYAMIPTGEIDFINSNVSRIINCTYEYRVNNINSLF